MNENKKGVLANKRKVASLEPSKPRNFVAKNAINAGAGAHKDKKKAMKQGDNKHKKLDYAESLELRLAQKLSEEKIDEFLPVLGAVAGRVAAGVVGAGRAAATAASLAGRAVGSTVGNALDNDEETDEDVDSPEYNDEAGMSYGSLHTIARAADGLLDTIKEGDNLPEWCQEKISLAEDYLITVWDYLQSEKEQGVAEDAQLPGDFKLMGQNLFLKNLARNLKQRYPDATVKLSSDRVTAYHNEGDDEALSVMGTEVMDSGYIGVGLDDAFTESFQGVLVSTIKQTTEQLLAANPGTKPALFLSTDNWNPDAWTHIATKLGYRLVADDESLDEQDVAEGSLELNTPDPVVVIQDLKGNMLDKLNLSVASQKYKLGNPQNIKNQLAHQNYTTVGSYVVVSPMGGQPQDKTTQGVAESWSKKYKSSINCSHPKGFSQKAHCAGKKKHNEDMSMEAVCPDCGMCETHGNLNEIKKGAKDSNGYRSCWKGYHAAGTKKGKNGGQVRNCVPNEGVAEGAGNRCKQCGMIDCPCPGVTCKCKPIAGWVPGKGFKKAMDEKLNLKAMDTGAVIKDFEKSNAPQFRGKTKEKRKQMAIAAKNSAMKKKKKIGESVEEWTTDSLASHLFEQELTYEDRLNNMLSKKLSK